MIVRDFLRKHQTEGLSTEDVIKAFGSEHGEKLLHALIEKLYVEAVDIPWAKPYQLTLNGGSLARASAGPMISRAKAESALKGFIERCHEVKGDSRFLFKVDRAWLFGSMLTAKRVVSDVDIAVHIVPKDPDCANSADLWLKHAEVAERKGRRFSSILQRLGYPYDQVRLHLKARSRTLQLHRHDDLVLMRCESRLLYDDNDDSIE